MEEDICQSREVLNVTNLFELEQSSFGFTLKNNSPHYYHIWCIYFIQRLSEIRQLPAAGMSAAIVTAVAQHQVIVIRGHTGCGKTNQKVLK